MMPLSPGRPRTYSVTELKNLWKDFKMRHPKGTRKTFSEEVKLSPSRIKAVLNDHPSEISRIERSGHKRKFLEKERYHFLEDEQERSEQEDDDDNGPTTGLMFFRY